MTAIDCDVHCAPASYDALLPYLSDYWRQHIAEAGIRLTGLAHAALAVRQRLEGRVARGSAAQAPPVRVRGRALLLYDRAGAPAR